MKKHLVLLLVALVASCLPQEADARVLFVGNSHTFYNDMPKMVAALAGSVGTKLEVDQVVEGGAWLKDHVADGVARDRIRSGEFDYVVIQEQQAVPSDRDLAVAEMFPAASILKGDTVASGADLILFQTWARSSGFGPTGHDTYTSMQQEVISTYQELSEFLDKPVAPVGEAWAHSIAANPGIVLFQADGSHATPAGSYLAAVVIAARITGTSPMEMEEDLSIPPAHAEQLRLSAAAVIDS